MKLFQTPKLSPTLHTGMDCYGGRTPKNEDQYPWLFCKNIVRDYFDIPDDAENVKFIAHDCPGADRVPISRGELETYMDPNGRVYSYYDIVVDGDPYLGFFDRAVDKIQKLLKKHKQFYVECYYEG